MATRLDIINHMLATVGESGQSSVDSLHPSVLQAKTILNTTDIDFQGPGWHFNREYELNLLPDENGEIQIPANTMEFKLSGVEYMQPKEKTRYVKRGTRLYDTLGHTFNIGTNVVADIVTQIAIEDLPAVAFSYLLHEAALAMYIDDDGDTFKTTKLEERVSLAWQKLKAAELKVLAVNALDNPVAQRLRGGTGTGRNPNLIGG